MSYPEPDDPLEPLDEKVQVCNDCGRAAEYLPECECPDSSGYTDEWWFKCQICREVFQG
jgi:hypothetical protein